MDRTTITRRSLIAGAIAAPVVTAMRGNASVLADQSSKRPNVLFFLPDQVRRCEVGCYGGGQNAPTPNVDRLATQGTRFTNALSTYPLCTPYRAMLQTGRMPALSGGIMNFINLPSTGQSMADIFSHAGYETGYIGKWHLASGRLTGTLTRDVPPPNVDPESEFVPPGPARLGYQHWEAFNFHTDFAHAFYYRDTRERLFMPKYETDSETDMAIDFMKKNKSSKKPFFLVVSPHPPHPEWRKEQTPSDSLAATPRDLHKRPNVKGWEETPTQDPHCYYAMIRNMDENLGRLTSFLDEEGLAKDTIVVFASDHGEMLASQSRHDKMVPYAEAVDVPLIVRWPGHVPAGHTSDVLYTPVDHFPTLAAMCGTGAPAIVNGKDLSWAALGSRGTGRDDVLLMNFTSQWDFPETNTIWPEWRGVKDRQYTYVRWLNGAEELYDNRVDIYQTRNLFDGRDVPPALAHFRQRLTALLKEAHDDFMPGDQYITWFDKKRNVIRNALGPIDRSNPGSPSSSVT